MTVPVSQIMQFACTVPAGTAEASPAVFPMLLLNLDIVWLEWRVPPGPRGDVGFWIGSHGQPIIPYTEGPAQFIVTDDEKVHWDLVDQPDSGDWELQAYNVGVKPHTLYIRWGLAVPPGVPASWPAPLSTLSLSGATGGA